MRDQPGPGKNGGETKRAVDVLDNSDVCNKVELRRPPRRQSDSKRTHPGPT